MDRMQSILTGLQHLQNEVVDWTDLQESLEEIDAIVWDLVDRVENYEL